MQSRVKRRLQFQKIVFERSKCAFNSVSTAHAVHAAAQRLQHHLQGPGDVPEDAERAVGARLPQVGQLPHPGRQVPDRDGLHVLQARGPGAQAVHRHQPLRGALPRPRHGGGRPRHEERPGRLRDVRRGEHGEAGALPEEARAAVAGDRDARRRQPPLLRRADASLSAGASRLEAGPSRGPRRRQPARLRPPRHPPAAEPVDRLLLQRQAHQVHHLRGASPPVAPADGQDRDVRHQSLPQHLLHRLPQARRRLPQALQQKLLRLRRSLLLR